MLEQRKFRWFDLCGLVCLVALAVVVVANFDAVASTRTETPLTVSAADLEHGFRSGVSWFGLYLNDSKVGFARIDRRISRGSSIATNHVTLRPVVFGARVEIDADLEVVLDDELKPTSFSLISTTVGFRMTATGRRSGHLFEIDLIIGDSTQHLELAADDAWTDLGLRPAFLRTNPTPGERRTSQLLDPLGLRTVTMTIEYVGVETIAVLGQETTTHHLRHEVEGQVFNVWVNDLGEALREEMPLGLTAIRESEASATYGFGRGAPPLAEAELGPTALQDLLKRLPTAPGGTP